MSEQPTFVSSGESPPGALPPGESPPEAPRAARWRGTCLGRLMGAALVLVGLLLVSLLGSGLVLLVGEREFAGRVYPHVNVRGMDMGLYDSPSAGLALRYQYESFLQNPVELAYADQVWQPDAADLGLTLHLDEAAAAALAQGRGLETRADNLRTVAAIWQHGIELPLHVTIDQAAIQRYVLHVAQSIERPPRDAAIRLDGAQIVLTSERDGLQVLVNQTVQDITAALQNTSPQQVPIRTRALSPVMHDGDIAPIAAQAQRMLGTPIVLTSEFGGCAPECRWEWLPLQLAEWVTLHRSLSADGRTHYELTVDQSAIQQKLVPVARAIHFAGGLPRVHWNDGQPLIFQPGTPGRGLDAPLALTRINEALHGAERTIDLPLTAVPPPVIQSNLASLGMTELIGVGVSSFRASAPYRITNIRAGAARMHGIMLRPGETFSFNDNLGVVDGRNGFVQGLAIVQNRTQKEWGGGLCQVSTTMFRAAFWSGLPITERHEHTFRIPWYEELGEPPGLDAAIFTGAADMRFVNDTGGYVLIQAWVDVSRQRLTVALYGSTPARQVTISHAVLARTPALNKPLYIDDPALPRGYLDQTDWAQPGMTVEVYRTVREQGQVRYLDTFTTVFEPWPNIFVRGTG